EDVAATFHLLLNPGVRCHSTLPPNKYTNHNWEFLVAVLVTAISVSIIIALLAKCQVVRRYLAKFAMHGGRGVNPHCVPPVGEEEDDDGFIEDNYIPATEVCVRAWMYNMPRDQFTL
uniref:Uncharacterized protein n=1 Tax=Scophthalmus maximus TaxID=52904 RepID=A0A8D3BG38_SCOMX